MSSDPYYGQHTPDERIEEIAEVLRIRSGGELEPSQDEIVRASLAVAQGYTLEDPSPAERMLSSALERGGLKRGGQSHENLWQRQAREARPKTNASTRELLSRARASGATDDEIVVAALERAAYTALPDGSVNGGVRKADHWFRGHVPREPLQSARRPKQRATTDDKIRASAAAAARLRGEPKATPKQAEPEPDKPKRKAWQDLIDDAREKRHGLGGNRSW